MMRVEGNCNFCEYEHGLSNAILHTNSILYRWIVHILYFLFFFFLSLFIPVSNIQKCVLGQTF